jgi:hypothetical protein
MDHYGRHRNVTAPTTTDAPPVQHLHSCVSLRSFVSITSTSQFSLRNFSRYFRLVHRGLSFAGRVRPCPFLPFAPQQAACHGGPLFHIEKRGCVLSFPHWSAVRMRSHLHRACKGHTPKSDFCAVRINHPGDRIGRGLVTFLPVRPAVVVVSSAKMVRAYGSTQNCLISCCTFRITESLRVELLHRVFGATSNTSQYNGVVATTAPLFRPFSPSGSITSSSSSSPAIQEHEKSSPLGDIVSEG